MDFPDKYACAILFCYNEESIIGETLKHYLSQGIDLVAVDNCSTDSSMDIVKMFQDNSEKYPGKILEVISVETEGYDWRKILQTACSYMHAKLNRYAWILLVDADAFYYSPVKDMSLLEYMETVKKHGYNIINGLVYDFYPTEKDDPAITSCIERIKYCQIHLIAQQQKIFLYHNTIDFYTRYGHYCDRDHPRIYNTTPFIYKHYPWISYEHGLKKIFFKTRPRYTEKWMRLHPLYCYMLPLKGDFVKDSRKLMCYSQEESLISRRKFLWIDLPLAKWINAIYGTIRIIWKKTIIPDSFRDLLRSLKSLFEKVIFQPHHTTQSEVQIVHHPTDFHFLMTNYCNARCIFCNQFDTESKKEITLDKFKTITSHILMDKAQKFCFSGGGEPLLCRDLFDIIKYMDDYFPNVEISIRTNGLLIEKYAQDIVKAGIDRLEISVHGAELTNNSILQVNNSENIFKGLSLVNKYQKQYAKKMYKVFYVVVSRLNVNEVPQLIKRAAELDVDEVAVQFSRYYPHKIGEKFRTEDSLFFHKQAYDEVIKKSVKLAKALRVKFTHEPLFSKEIIKQQCCLPWYLILIDWDGEVYPCTGGEVYFYEKVKAGIYHFGNLLKEDLLDFWLSETYTKLRRTLLSSYSEKSIPECEKCHNIICFEGPNERDGHIIRNEEKNLC